MKKEIKTHWHTWIFVVTIGIVLIFAYKALDSIGYLGTFLKNLLKTISPFLVGLLMAYLLYIPEKKIEKLYKKFKNRFFRKKARTFAIFTTYIIAILILIIIVNFILPVLVQSINELIGNLQGYYSKIIGVYNNLPNDSVFKTEQVYTALKELQNFDLKQYVSIDRMTGYVKSAVNVAVGVFDIFIAIVVSVYILAERDEILKFFGRLCKAMFKEDTYKNIERYFYKSNGVFFKFISSQFIDAIVVGLLATIAMKILKIKYAPLLGFTIGLFNMIPYFGAIIAIAISRVNNINNSRFFKSNYYAYSSNYFATNRCKYN